VKVRAQAADGGEEPQRLLQAVHPLHLEAYVLRLLELLARRQEQPRPGPLDADRDPRTRRIVKLGSVDAVEPPPGYRSPAGPWMAMRRCPPRSASGLATRTVSTPSSRLASTPSGSTSPGSVTSM
jgi:hypothetical protein